MALLLRRAPVDDVVAWGESLDHLLECKSKLDHGFTPLTLTSNSRLSIVCPLQFSAYHPGSPSGFPWEDPGYILHQIHLEIYLRRMTLAEIRGLIWAAGVDRMFQRALLHL